MDEAPILNLSVDRGAYFSTDLVLSLDDVDTDLTGATAIMRVRSEYDVDPVLLELTNGAGITFDPEVVGKMTIAITPEQIDTLPIGSSVYDLFLTLDGGQPEKLFYGKLVKRGSVSK